jgi:membrane protease YdiL (CAAX protease family)
MWVMYRPWLSLLAWLLVVGVVRAFWLIDVPPRWLALDETAIDGLLKVGLWVAPPLVFLMLLVRQPIGRAWRELGLASPPVRGYAFGALATVPMALVLPFAPRLTAEAQQLVSTVVVGPFAEEVLFRGFLLAFLVRRAGWSLPVALVVTSLAFGLAHVPQSHFGILIRHGSIDWLERMVLPMTVVAAGGLVFGWVYYRWGNLWYAIGLHASINLWWELTSGRAASAIANSDTLPISAAHIASFGLAVLLTMKLKRSIAPEADRQKLAATSNL